MNYDKIFSIDYIDREYIYHVAKNRKITARIVEGTEPVIPKKKPTRIRKGTFQTQVAAESASFFAHLILFSTSLLINSNEHCENIHQ